MIACIVQKNFGIYKLLKEYLKKRNID